MDSNDYKTLKFENKYFIIIIFFYIHDLKCLIYSNLKEDFEKRMIISDHSAFCTTPPKMLPLSQSTYICIHISYTIMGQK